MAVANLHNAWNCIQQHTALLQNFTPIQACFTWSAPVIHRSARPSLMMIHAVIDTSHLPTQAWFTWSAPVSHRSAHQALMLCAVIHTFYLVVFLHWGLWLFQCDCYVIHRYIHREICIIIATERRPAIHFKGTNFMHRFSTIMEGILPFPHIFQKLTFKIFTI